MLASLSTCAAGDGKEGFQSPWEEVTARPLNDTCLFKEGWLKLAVTFHSCPGRVMTPADLTGYGSVLPPPSQTPLPDRPSLCVLSDLVASVRTSQT